MRKTLMTLVGTIVLMVGQGIVLLASASVVKGSQAPFHDPHHFVKLQLIWLCLSLVVAVGASYFDYHWWRESRILPLLFYFGVLLLLGLVITPHIRRELNGSFRWLCLGPVNVQPSEFSKLMIVVVMSVYLDYIGWRVRKFWYGAFFPVLFLSAVIVLLLLEPDYGALMVVGMTGGVLLFIAGSRFIHLIPLGLSGVVLVGGSLMLNQNRMNRIRAWFFKEETTHAAAYQLQQAILAFKNGGPFGVGFNQSIQKWNYLPEAHTDFIFAIGAEELGFLFSFAVVIAFLSVLVCGVMIALRAPDRLGRLLAFGMTFLLVFQAAFNIGVVTGCLPTKGIALPFFSYGGTNLITAMFAIGTLINVGRHVDVFDDRNHAQTVKNAVTSL